MPILAWTPAADQSAGDLLHTIGLVGGGLFAALLLFLILRALVQQPRYRVTRSFGADDLQAVKQALVAAEKRTVGEIVPVIVERSDPHPGPSWFSALCMMLAGSWLLGRWLPWDSPELLLPAQLGLGAAGYLLARLLPGFKRAFIREERATAVAEEQAFQEFYRNGLHKTQGATGVLIFVSLLERRVIVLAGEGIDSRVDDRFWDGVDAAVLAGIRSGSLRAGLVAGIAMVGEKLSQTFPWVEGDRNEIPDRVVMRRE